MNKHILFLFLFSFSTSAFALFPIENDWAKHHLQGKVKSIKSKEEGNSALPDNGSVSYLDAFYNEQGFLIKEKEQGVLFDKEKITIRHYKYDAQNRLLEIQDDNVTETNPELKTFSAFYRYVDNPDGSGVVQFVEYKDTPDFSFKIAIGNVIFIFLGIGSLNNVSNNSLLSFFLFIFNAIDANI